MYKSKFKKLNESSNRINVAEGIPYGREYKPDFKTLFNQAKTREEKEYIKYVMKRDPNIKFPFKYQGIILKDCGHYELLQSSNIEIFNDLTKGDCTPCVYKKIG